jgi:hypothetical protein
MTELEISDLACVCRDTVAQRRVELGLVEGTDYRLENKTLVYTETGRGKILFAFGIEEGVVPPGRKTEDRKTEVAGGGDPPASQGEAGRAGELTLMTAPVVWARVTRAKPNEAERNNRYFVAVVMDGTTGRATGRVLDLFCAKQGGELKRGRMVQALDMGTLLVLDRAELRRRGVNIR